MNYVEGGNIYTMATTEITTTEVNKNTANSTPIATPNTTGTTGTTGTTTGTTEDQILQKLPTAISNKNPKFIKALLETYGVKFSNGSSNGSSKEKDAFEEGKKAAKDELAFGSNTNPIERTFADVYKIIAYLCVVIFIALCLITALDVVLFSLDSFSQSNSLGTDPNIFNKDTVDYNVLQYIKTNTTTDEPYHVFLCENLFATIYVLVGIVITMIGLEYGVSVLLSFYNAYTGGNKNYSVSLASSKTYLIVIVVALVGAGVLTSVYNTYFINKTQDTMFNIQGSMTSIKNKIYANITTNQVFLTALISNDITTVLSEFSNTIKNGIHKSDTVEAQKMVFTISIYSYLISSIPVVDPNYNTVLEIFDYENIINRTIDPSHYLYYNTTSINIQNLYPKLTGLITGGITKDDGKSFITDIKNSKSNQDKDPFFDTSKAEQQLLYSKFISSTTAQLSSITQNVTELSVNGMNPGKNELFKYMILSFLAAFLFTIVLILVIYDEIPDSVRERVKLSIIYAGESVSSIVDKINIFKYFSKKKEIAGI